MRDSPVTIVDITSPSYTGTTWLCLLLGSHERAFTLGPPDRVWGLRESGFEDACRVHGKDCAFWRGFAEGYDPSENFYLQLADYAGRDFIVINNPTPVHEKAEMHHPDIVVKPIRVVRDGRALACSFSRHLKVDMYDAIRQHIQPLFAQFPLETDRDDLLAVRYEDALARQHEHVEKFGRFLGLKYPDNALEFWTFDHHMTSGNAGTMALLKFFQGLEVRNFKDRAFYESQFERMRNGEKTFDDQRWREELGRRELYLFDRFCGRGNASWGYEPDLFSSTERDAFEGEIEGKAHERSSELSDALIEVLQRIGRRRVRFAAIAGSLWVFSLILTGLVVWLVTRGGG
jgi:hypothetical protein